VKHQPDLLPTWLPAKPLHGLCQKLYLHLSYYRTSDLAMQCNASLNSIYCVLYFNACQAARQTAFKPYLVDSELSIKRLLNFLVKSALYFGEGK